MLSNYTLFMNHAYLIHEFPAVQLLIRRYFDYYNVDILYFNYAFEQYSHSSEK